MAGTIGVLATLACGLPAAAQDRDPTFQILGIPTISGTPVVGNQLTASGGQWASPNPRNTRATWQWWRCDNPIAVACDLIPRGPRDRQTYRLGPADLGKWIVAARHVAYPANADCIPDSECLVLPSGPVGPVTATAATPTPTPTATPAPPEPTPVPFVATPAPTPAPVIKKTPNRLMRPAPLVRMRGVLSSTGALITSLTVRAPKAAKLTVTCRGSSSCPRTRWSPKTRKRTTTRMSAFERNLRSGTVLTVTLTRSGYVGKRTVFKIRRGKAPLRSDACLSPVTGKVQKCPAG
jgi:hypothetical protein